MTNHKTIGIIAGSGRLPVIIAQGAKTAGCRVVCAGLGNNPDSQMKDICDIYKKVAIARPGSWIRSLKKQKASLAVMAGKVSKENLLIPWRIIKYLPDWRALKIFYIRLRKTNKSDQNILQAIADELAEGGIILEDSTKYAAGHLAELGVMTKAQPSLQLQQDIDYALPLAKQIADTGIGQALAVKEQTIIAVEAIEGTAEMIKRAGAFCKKGGWTLVKVCRADHDMRFDVPCVGIDTIKQMKDNGGKCLVVQAGKTIIIDKPQTIATADELGIIIVGI